MKMLDLQRNPWQLYMINNMEDIVVCLGLKEFKHDIFYWFSCSTNAQVIFETTIKNNNIDI